MAYTPIVNVDITISDVQVTAEGFGTPLFITTHRASRDRILSYTSAVEVGDFYGTDSAAYRAAVKVFGQSPSVPAMKIGRRDGELRLLPTDFTTGTVLAFTITNNAGIQYTATYTVQSGDDATDISTALRTSILTSSGITIVG